MEAPDLESAAVRQRLRALVAELRTVDYVTEWTCFLDGQEHWAGAEGGGAAAGAFVAGELTPFLEAEPFQAATGMLVDPKVYQKDVVRAVARGASVIKCPSPLNVLKDTYGHSCC